MFSDMDGDTEVSNHCYIDVISEVLSWCKIGISDSTEEDVEIAFLEIEYDVNIAVKDTTIQHICKVAAVTDVVIDDI